MGALSGYDEQNINVPGGQVVPYQPGGKQNIGGPPSPLGAFSGGQVIPYKAQTKAVNVPNAALPPRADVSNLSGPSEMGYALRRFVTPGGGHGANMAQPAQPPSPPLSYQARQFVQPMVNLYNQAVTGAANAMEAAPGAFSHLVSSGANAMEGVLPITQRPRPVADQAPQGALGGDAPFATAVTPQGAPNQQGALTRVDLGNGNFISANNPEALARVQRGQTGAGGGALAQTGTLIQGDQTEQYNIKQAQHEAGMQRLRTGLPYDANEYQALLASQNASRAPEAPSAIERLQALASGPAYNPIDIANQKLARKNLKVYGDLAGQEAQNAISQQNALAEALGRTEAARIGALSNEAVKNAEFEQNRILEGIKGQNALAVEQAKGAFGNPTYTKVPVFSQDTGLQTGEDIVQLNPQSGQWEKKPVQNTQGGNAVQVPQGMKQVGTYQGKPVFEDANGKRFVQD